MTRSRLAYGAVAASLAVVALAGVVGVFLLAPSGGTVTQAAAPESGQPAPVRRSLPIDTALSGTAAVIAKNLTAATADSVVGERTSRVCDEDVAGWVRSESARVSADGLTYNIQVAGYRAGAASTQFATLASAADTCSETDRSENDDEFIATRSASDGKISLGVLRLGDVLTIVSATGTRQDPATLTRSALAIARQTLTPRLAKNCVDPSSTSDGDLSIRDPYGDSYAGLLRAQRMVLPQPSPLTAAEVAAVTAVEPTPNWSAPAAKAYPELAVISDPQPAAAPTTGATPMPPINGVLQPDSGVVREVAPNLIDPDSVVEPKAERVEDPGSEPALPGFGNLTVTARVPVRDNIGPGCGWAFAGTEPPNLSDAYLAELAHDAVVAALVRQTAAQGQAMVDALSWPTRHREWVTAARTFAEWELYDDVSTRATAELTAAREAYQLSYQRWRDGFISREPSSTPTPTPTPNASESGASLPTPEPLP